MKKSKKRLLIATDTFLPKYDGATVLLNSILPALSKHYNITILAPDYGLKNYPNVNLVSVPLSRLTLVDYRLSRPCPAIISREVKRADIVFVASPFVPIGFLTSIYARRFKKKLIFVLVNIEPTFLPEYVGLHQPFKAITQFILAKFIRAFYNKCDLVIAPASSAVKELKSRGIKTKIIFIPGAVDIKKYKPTRNKERAKRKLGIGGIVIGYYGRIAREKSLATLTEAFTRLRKKYGNALHLLIVSPSTRLELPKLPGVKHIVIEYRGKMPNVVPYLQAMDIYVLPSLTETVSLSAIEAMACGVPVITTNAGWMSELVNKSNGLIFQKRNVAELTEKLEQLIRNKPLRQKLGAGARRTVARGYNLGTMIKKLEKAIDRI